MSLRTDVLVVGGGPAGLEAALAGAEAGMRVCLVDDNLSLGGQIWRKGIQAAIPAAVRLQSDLQRKGVEMRCGWRAVATPSECVLRIEQSGEFLDIEYRALILATGARERFLPFPGWTFPGVYGAGGLQAFVKSGFEIRGKRVVVAGTGPLLLAVAAHLREAGAQIVSIVEQASMGQLSCFALRLLGGHAGKLVEGMEYSLRTMGVPHRSNAWVMSVSGRGRVEKVSIRTASRIVEVACDMLAVGYHMVPNTELAQLLGCDLRSGYVAVGDFQETSVRGIFCAGEPTGIGGVGKARVEGRIAGLAASGQADRARALFGERARQARFARDLDAAFALRGELRSLAGKNTILCRCEDVLCEAVEGCSSWREAKLHTRCGMGPCEGRICGPAAEFLYGWTPPGPRPPLFPVEVAALADAPRVGT